MTCHNAYDDGAVVFNPWHINGATDLEQFLQDNYSVKFSDRDSGFDQTVKLFNAHRNMSDMAIAMYSYIIQSCQIGNFVNFLSGNPFDSFLTTKRTSL